VLLGLPRTCYAHVLEGGGVGARGSLVVGAVALRFFRGGRAARVGA